MITTASLQPNLRAPSPANRYRETNLTYTQYAEGAFIVRDALFQSAEGFSTNDLNCAWWNEYARNDSSDRDQLALGSAMATLPALQVMIDRLDSCTRDPLCDPLCDPLYCLQPPRFESQFSKLVLQRMTSIGGTRLNE